MISRVAAFVVWALVAATAVFWVLRMTSNGPSVPHAALAQPQELPLRADLSRVLGSTPVVAAPVVASPELSSRFVLSGVMAPKNPGGAGLALIAVDGNPPKPYSLGDHLDGELVLLEVSLRSASIGRAGAEPMLKLELAPLPPPSTGSFAPVSLGVPTRPFPVPPERPTFGLIAR